MRPEVRELSRRDELLDKAVAGELTKDEARELRELVQREASVRELDQRIKALIAFGVGAAAGYALPKLLELGIDSRTGDSEKTSVPPPARKK